MADYAMLLRDRVSLTCSRAQAYGARSRWARVIWRTAGLPEAESPVAHLLARRKDAWNRRQPLRQGLLRPAANLRGWAMSNEEHSRG